MSGVSCGRNGMSVITVRIPMKGLCSIDQMGECVQSMKLGYYCPRNLKWHGAAEEGGTARI